MGTLKNMPVMLQIEPHTDNAIKVARELIFNEFPINLGSIMFPITTWTIPTRKRTKRKGVMSPNCNKQ